MPKRQSRAKTRPKQSTKARSVKPIRPITLPADGPQPFLYDRATTARLMGNVCTMTLVRMEKQGKLTPIRLGQGARCHVFYNANEVRRLAGMEPVAQPNSAEASDAA